VTQHHQTSQGRKPPLIAVVGATGTGKTGLSIRLGRSFPIEIINADSRSFYRGMDIGTAKVTLGDREAVPHHLIDILNPDQPMSLAMFQDLAMERITQIHLRGNVPLIVGGTAQYVNAVVEGWSIPRVPPNEPLRHQLEREAAAHGVEAMSERLRRVDPESAARSGRNLRRIIRALEIHDATGEPMSALQGKRPVPFDPLEIELWLPRDVLHERIARRTRQMLQDGLVDEVRALLADGIPETAPAFSSIGYRQVLPLIAGLATEADVIHRIETDSHRLVRHQQTWFRKNPRLNRIDAAIDGWEERIDQLVRSHCLAWLTSKNAPIRDHVISG
jgi:tRNA dimethylallyltransferase